ncbi:UDP-2,3-diacylglucosamine diphosphatase [Thioalkalivibrio denitrificans]|uniref:UDP-2,3-diacylglucosamine diphosphatase n=1 Tax=Thioalkalivibrio denitrificans TaxID=108003 RepID=UPI000985CEEE|nr:UDP-2,3-diacylglucosamine diphosphatase [Thioalkalivibrio denitrificans]
MSTFVCRTAFISDVHLGTRQCRAGYLADFLARLNCERLVLVGDIIDLQAMRRRIYWDDDQAAVIEQIFMLARRGVEVIYIPGNHDDALRTMIGARIKGVHILGHIEHQTADGRRLLVSHGDEFDDELLTCRVQHWIGDQAYHLLLRMNHWIGGVRRYLRRPYWSLSVWAKERSGRARRYIARFEAAASRTARENGYDGYIGGHIHKAALRAEHGVIYCNTGDWVEHCTALIEDQDGSLHLIHWSDHVRLHASRAVGEAEAGPRYPLQPQTSGLPAYLAARTAAGAQQVET